MNFGLGATFALLLASSGCAATAPVPSATAADLCRDAPRVGAIEPRVVSGYPLRGPAILSEAEQADRRRALAARTPGWEIGATDDLGLLRAARSREGSVVAFDAVQADATKQSTYPLAREFFTAQRDALGLGPQADWSFAPRPGPAALSYTVGRYTVDVLPTRLQVTANVDLGDKDFYLRGQPFPTGALSVEEALRPWLGLRMVVDSSRGSPVCDPLKPTLFEALFGGSSCPPEPPATSSTYALALSDLTPRRAVVVTRQDAKGPAEVREALIVLNQSAGRPCVSAPPRVVDLHTGEDLSARVAWIEP